MTVITDFEGWLSRRRFATILADPPWQFQNSTGKVAPEHRRLTRYGTMKLDDIKNLPVQRAAMDTCHLYLWVPNALLPEGLDVTKVWGFTYKSNIVWHKIRKDGRSDERGVGFYFRNVTELDHVLVDELVFQALKFDHSPRFDRLALFAFIYSMVGAWKGAKPYQQRPALWAHYYIAERVARKFNWDTSRVSANDIEDFVTSDARYHAKTARKLSTNLNFLFQVGGLHQLASSRLERWWVDAMCLALDRIPETRRMSGRAPNRRATSHFRYRVQRNVSFTE
jgi:hypothetical protein